MAVLRSAKRSGQSEVPFEIIYLDLRQNLDSNLTELQARDALSVLVGSGRITQMKLNYLLPDVT